MKEIPKIRATPFTIRLNQHQSIICTLLYKRRWFKHRKFDQPFEIKAQNSCYPWEWRPQNYSGTKKRSYHKLW